MAKRFTATELWDEDWFLEMPPEYQLFWYYILAQCNHAGVFRVNLRTFCGQKEVKLSPNDALCMFNVEKQRVRVLTSKLWFIEDFFVYQYGPTMNIKNRVHKSCWEIYQRLEIPLTSIRGLVEVKDGVKDKDSISIEDIGDISKSLDTYSHVSANRKFSIVYEKMMEVFLLKFSGYFRDDAKDSIACEVIASNVEKIKGWKSGDCLNGHLGDLLTFWTEVVDYVAADKWLRTRSLTDLSTKEWQRLGQHMAKQDNPDAAKDGKKDPTEGMSDYQKDLHKKREAARNKKS